MARLTSAAGDAPGPFATRVQASFPSRVRFPAPLVAALDRLEAAGHVVETPQGPQALLLSPAEAAATVGAGGAAFHPAFGFTHWWLGSDDPAVVDRLVSFIDTGGDGSTAGIWLDDEGRQRFVHLGSGSGSL